jgi:hypothetical protein
MASKLCDLCTAYVEILKFLLRIFPPLSLPLEGEGLPCGVNSTTSQGKEGDDFFWLRLCRAAVSVNSVAKKSATKGYDFI